MTVDDPNVGIAFGLVCGAGGATALGASVVFVPSLVKLASRRVLAASLGVSAGVMSYVSFVEIFQKSLGSFQDAGHSEEDAYLYTTLCFFGGLVLMMIVDFGVRILSGGHHHHHHSHNAHGDPQREDELVMVEREEPEVVAPHCVGCSDDPVGELNEWHQMAEEEEKEAERRKQVRTPTDERSEASSLERGSHHGDDNFPENNEGTNSETKESKVANSPGDGNLIEDPKNPQDNKKLIRMGINTALAIGLHNFPEGLATFVAALGDPNVGAVLAIAIGIHNIPEGLCVALPIYYATGNRCKAFLWACISGVSEPVAALLGWAILANSFSDNLYAILFGFVAGMMVIISVKELLPTAHRYDPDDSVVTYSFMIGMVIMAVSLVLFVI